MSRSRWLALLGPPLIVILATGAASAGTGHRPEVQAETVSNLGSVFTCTTASDPPAARAGVGTWWRLTPALDPGGALTGWTLTGGDRGDGTARPVRLDLPPASSASGPDRGRVIVATDDGSRSAVRVVNVAAGCARDLDVGDAIARRAIADPDGDGVLVHLLARESRTDLGVWRVASDGQRRRILGPVDASTLRVAGLGRVWSTNLAATRDGRRLAVQSCDPRTCVTRALDRDSGRVVTLTGGQGDLIGFAGDRLVTMAACPGLPCAVLAWRDDGTPRVVAGTTLGAAVSAVGSVLIAVPHGRAGAQAIVYDPVTGTRREIGELPDGALPVPGSAATSGIEAGPSGIGLIDPTGLPSILEVQR